MKQINHHKAKINGLNFHYVTCGHGPIVILCHGFPGLWYTWKNQLEAIADAGYQAVAIDQRGFGQTERPLDAELYTSDIHCQDMIALLDHFNKEKAVFIGHDFGAPLVWNMAVRHPDKCIAIVPVSCPYDFDLAGRNGNTEITTFTSSQKKPTEVFKEIAENQFIHFHYFQHKGVAEKELGGNPKKFLKNLYYALSSEGNLDNWDQYPSEGTGYLDVLEESPKLPWRWLDENDLDYLVEQYMLEGAEKAFIGGLNNYRVADLNWELSLPYINAIIETPTLFIAGENDPVIKMVGESAMEIMHQRVKNLYSIELIKNAGHFVQIEQKDAFNELIVKFLKSLKI